MRVLCIAPNFQLNIGTKCQFSIHPLLKKPANNRALCEMILWCKKISISRSWEYVKNGPPAKGALWLLKGSFQSLHWHHNIWIQFRNRCISNMQILSGKGLVIVLAPFIVAEIFKWILCHVYGKITKSVRSTSFLWEMKKKRGLWKVSFSS